MMIRRSYGRWCAYKDYRRVYAVLDNVRNLRNCTRVLEAYARFVLAQHDQGLLPVLRRVFVRLLRDAISGKFDDSTDA
jgi:hypothetical protein